jgi:alkanesulfonate monooxygenase SsuD/methylene tetrahydromethanopterin reductase-like flavin-dependent oxidoreductase (luciferase family)
LEARLSQTHRHVARRRVCAKATRKRYQRRFLDSWSLISALLAGTKRISFFTDVAICR